MYKIIGGDDQEYGPVTADVLREWIAEGRANAQTRVLPQEASVWKPLGELPEFAAALAAASAPRQAPMVQPATSSTPKTNSLAVTGLLLGVVSVSFGLCCCGGVPLGAAGAICSGVALSQLSRNQQEQGRGVAIAGLVISLLGLFLSTLVYLIGSAFSGSKHWYRSW